MTQRHYDVIVLGLGGIGSAAVYHVARRGHRVAGLEQFTPAHDRGSSHGHTRAIRKAYFEHADYVPLLHGAYDGWASLESESGRTLFERVGIIQAGPPAGEVCRGILRSASEHNLPVDTLTPTEFRERFPGLRIHDSDIGIFERDAGFLYVERGVQTCLDLAAGRGAEFHFESPVRQWGIGDDQRVWVKTDRHMLTADRLIVAAGAWAARNLDHLRPHLQVLRKHLHWFSTTETNRSGYELGHFPVFFFETLGGFFYGFPIVDAFGLKVAEHSGGTPADPDKDDRRGESDDDRRVESFLKERFQGTWTRTRQAVCFYTVTPDHHFILETHPRHPQVVYVAGLSGHGYKFAPALGQVLADLACDGATNLPIEFLHSGRLSGAG